MASAVIDFWVDSDWCLGHYLCADLAPLFFENDGGAWAVSVRPSDFTALSSDDAAAIYRAAAHCPVAAIKIRLETGEILDAHSPSLKRLAKKIP